MVKTFTKAAAGTLGVLAGLAMSVALAFAVDAADWKLNGPARQRAYDLERERARAIMFPGAAGSAASDG